MIITGISITKTHPAIPGLTGGTMIDKGLTQFTLTAFGYDVPGNEVQCEVFKGIESPKDETAIIAELLYELADKMKPQRHER